MKKGYFKILIFLLLACLGAMMYFHFNKGKVIDSLKEVQQRIEAPVEHESPSELTKDTITTSKNIHSSKVKVLQF